LENEMFLSIDSQVFQPCPSSYSLDGTGLAAGVRIVRRGGHLFVVAGEEQAKLAVIWIHGNAADCGFESQALACIALSLNALVIGVEWPGYGPLRSSKPTVEMLRQSG
jgi:hypothetical protein